MTEPPIQHSPNQDGSRNRPASDKAKGAKGGLRPDVGASRTANHVGAAAGGGGISDSKIFVTENHGGGGVLPSDENNGGIGGPEGTQPPHGFEIKRQSVVRRYKAGDVILKRYVVQNELGQGGMGVVYRCLDTIDKSGRTEVAVKALPPEVSHNQAEMDDMWENYSLINGLIHENIAACKTLEMDADTGDYYLVMEYVPGEDMRRWMKRKRGDGSLTLATVLPVLMQVAVALDAAHKKRIMHRDIKPDNVRIKPDGSVKVLDFGLAAQIRSSLTHVSQEYASHAGTNLYKAPEQWRGQPQGEATDQYALAVTAYELLSGRVPFEDDNVDVLKKAVLENEVVPIDGLPPYANEALRTGLAKEPAERYENCVDFVRALGGEKIQRKTAVAYDEDRFFILMGQIKDYRDKYEKREWDRGQTFGSHMKSLMDAWYGASAAASQVQNYPKAYEYLLKAESERQWLEHNLPLREKATENRVLAQNQQKLAEEQQASSYAKEEWREALHSLEEATQHFEAGEFEAASEGFAAAASQFEKAGKEALAEHVRQLEKSIATAMGQKDFSKCEDFIHELSALDAEQARKQEATVQDAKKAYIGQLKASILENANNNRLADADEGVQALMAVDLEEGRECEKFVKGRKDTIIKGLEQDVDTALNRNRFAEAEGFLRDIAIIDVEKAENLRGEVQKKKDETILGITGQISEELKNSRFETAHDKVRKLAAISEELGKQWEKTVHISELEQIITDAVAANRFGEADSTAVELAALNEERGRLKKETIEKAKTERIRDLTEFIAEELEQAHFKSAREKVYELAAINAAEGQKWGDAVRVGELEQIISDFIVNHRFAGASEAIGELTALDADRAREKTAELNNAKEVYVHELVTAIAAEMARKQYSAADEKVRELAAIDTAEAEKQEEVIRIRKIVDAVEEAIGQRRFADADKAVRELISCDADKARELAGVVQLAKEARVQELEQFVRKALEQGRFDDCRASIDEIYTIEPPKAQELEQLVKDTKAKVIAQQEAVIAEAIEKGYFASAHEIADRLAAIDREAGRRQEENICACELDNSIAKSMAKKDIAKAEKDCERLAGLNPDKAREWSDAIRNLKTERVAELSGLISAAVTTGRFNGAYGLLQELEAFDKAEADKWRDIIRAKKDGHVGMLAQAVVDAIEEKRFEDAEKAVAELGDWDSLKAAECGKKIKDAKEYSRHQLEMMINDCLTQDRFEDAEKLVQELAAIDDTQVAHWKDVIRLGKLKWMFEEVLGEKRFDEAKEIIHQVSAFDSEKARQMEERLRSGRSEYAKQLEQGIREKIGQKNFVEAWKLVKILAMFNNHTARNLEGFILSRQNTHISQLGKECRRFCAVKNYPDAHATAKDIAVLDATKGAEWEAFVKKEEENPDKKTLKSWQVVGMAALFVCLLAGGAYCGHIWLERKSLAAEVASLEEGFRYNDYQKMQNALYGRTFDEHVKEYVTNYENGCKARREGQFAEARAFFQEAKNKYGWLESHLRLAKVAADARNKTSEQYRRAKDKKVSDYVYSDFQKAVESFNNAAKALDDGLFEQARITFDNARKAFETATNDALEKKISTNIKVKNFLEAESDIKKLEKLDSWKAYTLKTELNSAKKAEEARKAKEAWKAGNVTGNVSSVPKTITLPGGVELKLVKIPAGSFSMGTSKDEFGRDNDENQHKVKLTQDYWLGQYEVTQAQYEAVMGKNPSNFKFGGLYPVENVSWADAMEFCRKLTELERQAGRLPLQYEYSLPTEAQWEYACRAGTTTALNNGTNLESLDGVSQNLDIVGWYRENSDYQTWPVGQKNANIWGLYDMHGNVAEWCLDWYKKDGYANELVEDPAGPSTGSQRVNRGGSWFRTAKSNRSAYRSCHDPEHGDNDLGFRVALVPVAASSNADKHILRTNSEDAKRIPLPTSVQLKEGVSLDMVEIKAGSFWMGSPDGEQGRYSDERRHFVTLSRNYCLGKYEVTQGQWKAVMETSLVDQADKKHPGDGQNWVFNEGDDYPMYFVSWDEAMEFCRRITTREREAGRLPFGYEYSLPTEAQWEYACRAGTDTALYNGPINIIGEKNAKELDEIAWYGGNSSVGYRGRGVKTDGWKEKQYPGGNAGPRKVGGKNANGYGLHDMLGNVFEWCRDAYEKDYASNSEFLHGQPSGYGRRRVYRGGSWFDNAAFCRSAIRFNRESSFRNGSLGFRVALVPVQ